MQLYLYDFMRGKAGEIHLSKLHCYLLQSNPSQIHSHSPYEILASPFLTLFNPTQSTSFNFKVLQSNSSKQFIPNQSNPLERGKFLRKCGAASLGECNRVISSEIEFICLDYSGLGNLVLSTELMT